MPKQKVAPLAESSIAAAERARTYIGTHCLSGATLKKAAKSAGLSPFHLHRCFTKNFGETPKAFQTRMQIEAAKFLMEDGVSLAKVAKRTGFAHAGHFSARFRSVVGMTPTAWMRKHCNGKK